MMMTSLVENDSKRQPASALVDDAALAACRARFWQAVPPAPGSDQAAYAAGQQCPPADPLLRDLLAAALDYQQAKEERQRVHEADVSSWTERVATNRPERVATNRYVQSLLALARAAVDWAKAEQS